jgi:ArsR family transcriptional regulator
LRIRKTNNYHECLEGIDFELIATISDAMSHPVRLELFRYIMQCNKNRKDVCNKDLVAEFDYAQATISQHMKTLVKSGLVDIRKKDRYSYYYANLGVLMRYLDAARKFSVC